jgi:hypothetical protein
MASVTVRTFVLAVYFAASGRIACASPRAILNLNVDGAHGEYGTYGDSANSAGTYGGGGGGGGGVRRPWHAPSAGLRRSPGGASGASSRADDVAPPDPDSRTPDTSTSRDTSVPDPMPSVVFSPVPAPMPTLTPTPMFAPTYSPVSAPASVPVSAPVSAPVSTPASGPGRTTAYEAPAGGCRTCLPEFEQCGGGDLSESACCLDNLECAKKNEFYAQCLRRSRIDRNVRHGWNGTILPCGTTRGLKSGDNDRVRDPRDQ